LTWWKSLSKKWRIALLIVAVIVAFFGSVAMALIKGWQNRHSIEADIVRLSQAIAIEDYGIAYAMFSQEYKDVESLEEFTREMESIGNIYSNIQEAQLLTVSASKYAGKPMAYIYTGKVKYMDGEDARVIATVTKENGVDKFYGIHIDIPVSAEEMAQVIKATRD